MTASLQALIRAIDALKHNEPEIEGPQGATENIPVAPDTYWKNRPRATRATGATAKRGRVAEVVEI
jgi:hypothetical protein